MAGVIDRDEAATALDAMVERVVDSEAAVGDRFAYYADPETGKWETTPDGDWCGGHWIGLLWLAHDRVDDPDVRDRLADRARRLTDVLVDELPEGTMFRGMNLLYAGFRAYDVTGDRRLFGLGFAGADAMVENFVESARQIPLGRFQIRGPENFRGEPTDDQPAGDVIGAVDNVYTALPVLWRAYRETGDPRFRDVAVSHADRHLDWYLREDGSTWHHAVFDPETGALVRQYNELAYADDTCWARGQGWCIAGLARAYGETGAERYLDALEEVSDYYRENVPDDLVPYWDFEAPTIPDAPRDTSAAALTAYGLTRLETRRDGIRDPTRDRVADLREFGEDVLASLVANYLVTDPEDDRFGAVLHGCYNKPGEYVTDNELVWTDYYVASALRAFLGR